MPLLGGSGGLSKQVNADSWALYLAYEDYTYTYRVPLNPSTRPMWEVLNRDWTGDSPTSLSPYTTYQASPLLKVGRLGESRIMKAN